MARIQESSFALTDLSFPGYKTEPSLRAIADDASWIVAFAREVTPWPLPPKAARAN